MKRGVDAGAALASAAAIGLAVWGTLNLELRLVVALPLARRGLEGPEWLLNVAALLGGNAARQFGPKRGQFLERHVDDTFAYPEPWSRASTQLLAHIWYYDQLASHVLSRKLASPMVDAILWNELPLLFAWARWTDPETQRQWYWVLGWAVRALSPAVVTELLRRGLLDPNARCKPLQMSPRLLAALTDTLAADGLEVKGGLVSGTGVSGQQLASDQPLAVCAALGGNAELLQALREHGAEMSVLAPFLQKREGQRTTALAQAAVCTPAQALRARRLFEGSSS